MKTALLLCYDGTNYHGWQLQKNRISVAETLETAIFRLTGERSRICGCGRTDAGVHAERYVASFTSETKIPHEKLPGALNAHLPGDISVMKSFPVPDGFDPVRHCVRKEYTYRILNARWRDPFLIRRAWHCQKPLDIETISLAAEAFQGTHDFAAVRSLGTDVKTTVRTVYNCRARRKGDIIEIRMCANGFLYNMARAITGSLVYASDGKISPRDIPKMLESGDRSLFGPTAPAHGLYMTGVWYEDFAFFSDEDSL